LELTEGHGAHAVFDCISNNAESALLLRHNGRLASINGFPDLTKVQLGFKPVSVHQCLLAASLFSNDKKQYEELGHIGTAVYKLMEEGNFKKVKLHNYKLAETQATYKTLHDGKQAGKFVITIAWEKK